MTRSASRFSSAIALSLAVLFGGELAHAKGSVNVRPPLPPSPLDIALSPAAAAKKLSAFRKQVRTAAAKGKTPVVVFDFDDTLVRIFTGKEVPGASAYVNGLLKDGATIVYQCGRRESLRTATTALLTKNGMPVNDKAQLWLKSKSEKALTVDWKKGQKTQIEALGSPMGFFDNETNNSRMFRAAFPTSAVFRLATKAYYADPGGTGSICVIKDFCPTSSSSTSSTTTSGSN